MTGPAPDLSKLRIERDTDAGFGSGVAGRAGPAGGGPQHGGQDRSGKRPGARRGARGRAVRIAMAVLIVLALLYLLWQRGLLGLGGGVPEVEVAVVQRVGGAAAASGTAANGYVVARRQAALSTDIQGRLVELRVEEGDRVKSGDLIARLDTRQLEAALERTRNELASAQASAEWARLDFGRKEPLLATGAVSRAEVDLARAARDEAEALVAGLQAAQAETEVMISKSSVYAPFDGMITAKNAEVGEVVSSIGTGGNSRGSVATLVDFDTLEVQVELAQTSLKAARDGAPVLIFLDAWPDQPYQGRVRQIWPTANREKSTVELRAEFLQLDERVLPEMGVRVVFVPQATAGVAGAAGAEDNTPRVLVSQRAVVAAAGADAAAGAAGRSGVVWVLADGKVLRRDVTLAEGAAVGGRVHVLAGLVGGERVVLDPPNDLVEGAPVRVRGASK
ncbi:MAG: efflux RND transporter periplasmic adaptor subunit [Planctomycetota bacterium]